MFNYTTLKNIIGKDVALSQTMIDAINKWKKMLVGNADWCSDIVESLKLEEGICREFADSVLVEMEAKILNNDKMDKVLQKSLSDMSKKLQTGLALGAMVLRPLEKNEQLKQITDAIIRQSLEDLENVTKSLGFYLDYNGKKVLTPLSQVYSSYLDNACYDIVTGAFDYGSVLRRVVTQLTNSGLRKIEYGSGYASRVEVAARRAVMSGVANLTGEIADYNAKKLGTEYFEVEWHAGARPTHAVWQGQVWTKEQLYSVCGFGTVTGLLGANCYHTYYPFFPGISQRNWSDEWLEAQNRKESKPKEFRGKEYTLYEAKQLQRQMETAMRAQREKVQMLQDGGADPDEVMLQKAKYQGQLNEYAVFSRKMGLKEERERIYIDGRGWIATNTKLQNSMFPSEMIQNALKDIAQYKRYKEVLGDSVGTLAKFGQVKYNDSEEWEKVQSKFFTYLEIDKKDWSEEFKNTSKQAYDRFAKENVVMSVHALSRLPRLNKPGLPEVSEEMLIKIIKGTPNYTEGEDKQIYFIHELQLLVVRNKKTGDIVSVVRRRAPKEAWGNV